GSAFEGAQQLLRVGELRHGLRVHERCRFDHGVAGLRETRDELELCFRRERARFGLQPVARADLDDLDPSHESAAILRRAARTPTRTSAYPSPCSKRARPRRRTASRIVASIAI